jgi:hypothetical protein
MPSPPPFHPDRRRRSPEEQEVYEALAVLSHGERLELLRDMPLPRSVKLGGASVIAHRARQAGVLGEVLAAIRSRQQ